MKATEGVFISIVDVQYTHMMCGLGLDRGQRVFNSLMLDNHIKLNMMLTHTYQSGFNCTRV